MSSNEGFGLILSGGIDPRDAWAICYRDSLTKCAEETEFDPSSVNRLGALIELISDLVALSGSLPLPDGPMDPLDVDPLQRLLEALVDIEAGHPVEFLNPARSQRKFRKNAEGLFEKKPGRSFSRHATKRVRAIGAAFVRLLVSLEMHYAAAARLVAARFTKAGVCGHEGADIKRTSVQTWIRLMQDGTRPGEQALAKAYEALLRRRLADQLTTAAVEAELAIQAQLLAKR